VTPERLDELHQTHERYALNHEEITELFAALDAANAERDEANAYAAEGWEWLGQALAAGGWATVFDIPRIEAQP
jgi:hypothetical protein